MGRKWIGIDVGGTTVKIGLFEEDGRLLGKREIPTRREEYGAFILSDTARAVRAMLAEDGVEAPEVAGAGIGVPGPVTGDGRVPVCVNLGWKDRDPARELGALLGGMRVRCANDANAAALGEMWQGGGRGFADIVMLTLGTGVGGGVVIGGKILAGRHGLAGEIGHIHVRDGETEPCNCGGRGCLEQVASATGIVREARRHMASSERPSVLRGIGEELTAKDVLDAARAGDTLALGVTDVVCRYLGVALAAIAQTVDPEAFVIGGGVSGAGPFLIDRIRGHYEEHLRISSDRPLITLARLGGDAGIYGAARLASE